MIGLAEIMAVMYVYGHKKFTQDIEDMTGVRPGILAHSFMSYKDLRATINPYLNSKI